MIRNSVSIKLNHIIYEEGREQYGEMTWRKSPPKINWKEKKQNLKPSKVEAGKKQKWETAHLKALWSNIGSWNHRWGEHSRFSITGDGEKWRGHSFSLQLLSTHGMYWRRKALGLRLPKNKKKKEFKEDANSQLGVLHSHNLVWQHVTCEMKLEMWYPNDANYIIVWRFWTYSSWNISHPEEQNHSEWMIQRLLLIPKAETLHRQRCKKEGIQGCTPPSLCLAELGECLWLCPTQVSYSLGFLH